MNKTKTLKALFILIFWVAIWYVVALLINQELLFPSPILVFERLLAMLLEKSFYLNVLYTLCRIVLALILGICLGAILALLSSAFIFVKEFVEPLIRLIRATPVTSFIILLLLYFSYSLVPVIIGSLMVLPIIYENILEGFKEVDHKLLEFAKVYRLSKKQTIKNIYIPMLKPFFYSGMVTSFGLAWKATVAAEVIAQPSNAIGTKIYLSKIYLETTDLFAYSLVVIFLSYVLEKLMTYMLNTQTKELKDDQSK